MTDVADSRFGLPVESLISEVLARKAPQIDTHFGSAVYDVLVVPAALIMQRFRDQLRVLQRNMDPKQYATMLPEELDVLASNFFVDRFSGQFARGVQRITFSSPQAVVVPLTAIFSTADGKEYVPVRPVSVPASVVANNIIENTGEFYVDVNIVASRIGERYAVRPNQIVNVSGVPNVLRTFNPRALVGKPPETNSELFARLKDSIANRDLVKRKSIVAKLRSELPLVRGVQVQGYGDALMTRDVAHVTLADKPLFEHSFCSKVNLPIDEFGEVKWTDDTGYATVVPTGGYVGAIYDLMGLDYLGMSVTQDGISFEKIAVQPQFRVRLLNPNDPDTLHNDFVVTKVEVVPVNAEGELKTVLRLNRPFADTTIVNPAVNLDQNPYRVYGFYASSTFHIGGKIDVYLDSENQTTHVVVVSSLPSISDSVIDVAEVPLTGAFIDQDGNNLFEGGVGFQAPITAIRSVEVVDTTNDSLVLRKLEPGEDYYVIPKRFRDKFSPVDSDVLVIRGSESFATDDGVIPTPAFTGQRIRITYDASPDVTSAQNLLNDPEIRDLTADIKVYPARQVDVDLDLVYASDVPESEVRSVLRDYINGLGFAAELSVSNILSVLTYFGVGRVSLPVTIKLRWADDAGTYITAESTDKLSIELDQVYSARSLVGVRQLL